MISKLGVQSVHAVSRGGLWASEAGKRRRLSRLADAEGRFAMLAVDQRTSLKNVLDDHLDADEQKRALQAVKRVVTRHNVKIANAAGASGFLCGRAVWKNVVQYLRFAAKPSQ